MKIVDHKCREIGKYYVMYRKYSGVFKSVSVFKYESIFGDITERVYAKYDFGVTIITDNTAPILAYDESITFELDGEEEFKQVTMPMVIENL